MPRCPFQNFTSNGRVRSCLANARAALPSSCTRLIAPAGRCTHTGTFWPCNRAHFRPDFPRSIRSALPCSVRYPDKQSLQSCIISLLSRCLPQPRPLSLPLSARRCLLFDLALTRTNHNNSVNILTILVRWTRSSSLPSQSQQAPMPTISHNHI